jgi:hypothetical protein
MWDPGSAQQQQYYLSQIPIPAGGRRERQSSADKAKERERDQSARRKRWRENLTAAGIGGAAVSLLNVLSEAAEGL